MRRLRFLAILAVLFVAGTALGQTATPTNTPTVTPTFTPISGVRIYNRESGARPATALTQGQLVCAFDTANVGVSSTCGSAAGTGPGGDANDVQRNDGASAFTGDDTFQYDGTTITRNALESRTLTVSAAGSATDDNLTVTASSGSVTGLDLDYTTGASAALDTLTAIDGFSHATTTGGNVTTVRGIYGAARSDVTTTTLYGFFAQTNSAAGTTTDSIAVYGQSLESGTGAVENGYGVRAKVGSILGDPTNGFGVYIDDVGADSTQYSIYSAGTDDTAYYAGSVGIGDTTPEGKLDVDQTVTAAGATVTTATVVTGSTASQTFYGSDVQLNPDGSHSGTGAILLASTASINSTSTATQPTARVLSLDIAESGSGTITDGVLLYLADVDSDVTNQYAIYNDSSDDMVYLGGGNVGIGDTTPDYPLDVEMTTTSTANSRAASVFISANPSGASSAEYLAGRFSAEQKSTIGGNLSDAVGVTAVRGVATANAASPRTQTAMHGGYFDAVNNATGTVTTARGIFTEVNNASSGTITNARGVEIDIDEAGGGGAITTATGLYINDLAGTTQYAIFAAGSGDEVYLASIAGGGTNSCVCIKSDGTLGTCTCLSCTCG